MESIKEKIQKILAIAERGGTEAEMHTAMAMAQELLAKHNLSMSDVEKTEVKDEDITEERHDGKQRSTWQGWIWNSISHLYFCTCYRSTSILGSKTYVSYCVVGKKSNVEAVRMIASYIIRLGEDLAKQPGTDIVWRNSFKNGFGNRVSERAWDEIRAAKTKIEAGPVTERALTVKGLYELRLRENTDWLKNRGITLGRSRRTVTRSRDSQGYAAGQYAGNSVSLRSSATRRIGH